MTDAPRLTDGEDFRCGDGRLADSERGPWRKPASLRERIEAAQESAPRLSSGPCSCPGAPWDSITPPPQTCARHPEGPR